MPESKNSSELRKLPGYKRRATEGRRGGGKKSRLEPSPVQVVGGESEETYFPVEAASTGPGYQCEASPLPLLQCSGSKYYYL